MTHYSDERAAEQAASSAQEQQPAGADELLHPVAVPKVIILQYLLGFILIFIDWRLALVFWLVASTNCLMSRLLYRLIQAVEDGNSVRGR